MKPELVNLALSLGFGVEAVKKWRQRGFVPAKHRDGLMRSASRRRLGLCARDLTFAPTKGTGTPRP